MKVSIVTVTFNSANTIRTTLESVANQSWGDIEHIIIDGGSSDCTLSIAREFKHISKIICEKDKGIYDAMNKGIHNATGDVIGFLNSDDWFANDLVIDEIARNFIAKNISVENLFNKVDRVAVFTSLGGFEALIRGISVTTYGLPFYAGWGLTEDYLEDHIWAKRRTRKLTTEELIFIALIKSE